MEKNIVKIIITSEDSMPTGYDEVLELTSKGKLSYKKKSGWLEPKLEEDLDTKKLSINFYDSEMYLVIFKYLCTFISQNHKNKIHKLDGIQKTYTIVYEDNTIEEVSNIPVPEEVYNCILDLFPPFCNITILDE